MPIDAAVAHIERAGNVHDGGFGEAKAAQYIFGGFETPFRSQNDDFIHGTSLCVSLSDAGSAGEFRGLGFETEGYPVVEAALDLGGQVKDFDGHGLSPLQFRLAVRTTGEPG